MLIKLKTLPLENIYVFFRSLSMDRLCGESGDISGQLIENVFLHSSHNFTVINKLQMCRTSDFESIDWWITNTVKLNLLVVIFNKNYAPAHKPIFRILSEIVSEFFLIIVIQGPGDHFVRALRHLETWKKNINKPTVHMPYIFLPVELHINNQTIQSWPL